jgi:hypothetical protein
MKLVLYDNSNVVVKTIKNIRSPVVEGNNIEWEEGSLSGINLPFLLLEEDVTVPEELTDEIKELDKRTAHPKKDYKKEAEELRHQLSETNSLILDFMESILV